VARPPSISTSSSPRDSLSALQSILRRGFQTSVSLRRVSQMRGSIVEASSIPSHVGMVMLGDDR